MKKLFIGVISLLLLATMLSCTSETSNDPAIVVSDYDVSKLAGTFLTSENEAYRIGSNSEGLPVFINTDLAWAAMLNDYADGLSAIQNSFNLAKIEKDDFEFYKLYGAQMDGSADVEISEQCKDISYFLDIYENSFLKNMG